MGSTGAAFLSGAREPQAGDRALQSEEAAGPDVSPTCFLTSDFSSYKEKSHQIPEGSAAQASSSRSVGQAPIRKSKSNSSPDPLSNHFQMHRYYSGTTQHE